MRTSTLFIPRDVVESEVAAALEGRFEAGWFPDYNRCTISTEDATVYIDFDTGHLPRLTPDEQRALIARLGFHPRTAIHVSASAYYPGSADLAERVLLTLRELLGGRALAAA